MSKFWERHKRQISIGATALVIFLSFIGSYQYYTGYVDEIVYDRLWSSVLYSTLKLYLFSPTVSAGNATPICYEIGKWLAPLCTAYWSFRAIESLFRHNIAVLRRKLGRKKQTVVFGYNETSEIFLRNIGNASDDRLVLLVTEQDLDKEKKLSLERCGILVYQMDLVGQKDYEMKENLKRLHLELVDEMILFYEDATWNFTLLKRLMEWAGEEEHVFGSGDGKTIFCSVLCEDRTMRKIITEYYDGAEGRKPWNLNLFALPDMAAVDLFERQPLYQNCLEWAVKHGGAKKGKDGRMDANTFMETIPQPHLLIVGFGRYGQAVFEKALLTGALSDRSKVKGYKRLRITIVDKNTEKCRDLVESRYPRIDQICRVSYIGSDIGSVNVEKALFQLPQITYIAICFSDQTIGVGGMEKIRTYLSAAEVWNHGESKIEMEIPIAVRMKTDGAVIQYRCQETGNIVSFGNYRQILTWDNVVRYGVEEAARDFHGEYMKIQNLIGAGGGVGEERDKNEWWNALNFELKESCRAQVLNRPYFRRLIELLPQLPDKEELLAMEPEAFLEKLSEIPALDVLAALEHKRWCNFCYCFGYAGFHPDKKEKRKVHIVEAGGKMYYGKVHNCLIDNWEEMKSNESVNGTIIYDVCSIYGYGR